MRHSVKTVGRGKIEILFAGLLSLIFLSGEAMSAEGFAAGDGSPENPYQVETAEHLDAVRDHLGAHFVQTTDIDLYDGTREGGAFANPTSSSGDEEAYDSTTSYGRGAVVTFENSKYISLQNSNQGNSLHDQDYWNIYDIYGWNPIGSGEDNFFGNYNGDDYTISGLFINRPAGGNIGLFGVIGVDGIVENVNMTDVDITGNVNIGSLAGLSFGHINNCRTTGNLFGTPTGWKNNTGGLVGDSQGYIGFCSFSGRVSGGRNIGGLVGSNYGLDGEPIIENSFADAEVFGSYYGIGGLVGYNAWGAVVRTSYSMGNVSGGYSVGGLVGANHLESTVENSYSMANVAGVGELGAKGAGGLVGANDNSQIINSYSTGTVTGQDGVGGLVGIDQYELIEENILNSYWDTETSGQAESFGGEGRTTDQMTYPYDADAYVDWGFVDVWAADTDGSINGGYPYLLGEASGVTSFALAYTAGEGGSIDGPASQSVANGEDGEPVTAVADSGWQFVQWSDGVQSATRQDTGVISDIEVIARFEEEQEHTAEAVYEAGPDMNTNRHNHNAVVLPDGNVALIAGRTTNFVSLDTTEIFDPEAETFTTLTMQHLHDTPSFAKMNDGRYLIAGGSKDLGIPSYDQTEIFDPADLSFTSTGSMVRFRANGGAAALNDGRVVIASAWWTHNDAHTYGELYDTETGTFSEIGPFNISRASGAVIPTTDGQALLVGGVRPTGNRENMPVELFNPETGEISVLQEYIINENEDWTFASSRTVTADQQLENDSYLWMVQNSTNGVSHYNLVTVNPETKKVEVMETSPSLPDSETFAFLDHPVIDKANNRAYLIARVTDAESYAIAAFTVDLAEGTLTLSSNFYSPEGYKLNSAPAVLLNDGRIFVSGGSVSDNFDAVNKTLFITPPEPQTAVDFVTLAYLAGAGGSIMGDASQSVANGEDGTAVTAVADSGWQFVQWSDGVQSATRQDTGVISDIEVIAQFEEEQGVPFKVIDTDPYSVSISASGNNVVRDSEGAIHVAYALREKAPPSAGHYIYASRSEDNGATWSTPVRTETMPDTSSPQTLAIDGDDVLHMGFQFNVGSFYTRSNDLGATWRQSLALHDGGWGDWDYSPQIAVDSNGDLSVVYNTLFGWGLDNLPRNLVYKESFNSGETWTPREDLTFFSKGSGPYGAVTQNYCLGRDGWRYVAYSFNEDPERGGGTPIRRLLYHDGVEWTAAQVSTPGRTALWSTGDMAVDSTGQLHLTWVEVRSSDGRNELMYRRFDPETQEMGDTRRLSLRDENPMNVTLGVYAEDTVAIAYDVHRMEEDETVFEGVYLRASDDDFRSPRRVSTHPNANTPNLRSYTEFMHNSEYWDMLWIEPGGDPQVQQLVHADVSGLSPVQGFAVETSADPAEGGKASGGDFVSTGESVHLQAVATEGWAFVAWVANDVEVSTEPSFEFTPQADTWLTAQFENLAGYDDYTLVYTAGEGGSIDGAASQVVAHGEDGEPVTAVADSGWQFVQWSDGVTDNPRTDTGVSGTVEVTAEFGIKQYTVTFNPGDHGELEAGAPNVEIVVEHGQPSPTPPSVINVEDGWSFDSWDPQLPDTVVGDLTTTATYASTFEWEFAINVGGATPESLSFGMSSGATDGVDDGFDETMTMPAADQAGIYLYRTAPEQAYRTDIIGTAGAGEWLLVVQAGADAPVELSWCSSCHTIFPDGRYLTMYEVDENHLPMGATARNMMVTQERTIGAGETAFLVIRFANTLVADIALREAWNLISLPLEPVEPSVSVLFDEAKVVASSDSGPSMRGTVYTGDIWTYYDKSYHTVTELEARVGYWVFAEEPATLLIEGTQPPSMDLVCKAGWNLLGPVAPMAVPTDNEHLRGPVWKWNADQQVYEQAETLYPCNGYWIYARSETTITSKTGEEQVAVPGMVHVEGGTFTMGDTWGDGGDDETPTHEVTVSSFSMSVTEATNQQVADLFQWAYDNDRITADGSTAKNANGDSQELLDLDDSDCQISFSDGTFSVDNGKNDHPCVQITWYGAAAYCNFLSEMEGRTPAYDLSDWNSCDWSADGYRLPTEAEWEYAARGGKADTDPGGDDAHKYAGSDENTSLDDVAWYNSNSGSHSHEVGKKAANELGLHDLSGNVWEWCWDWYGSGYYSDSPGTNPRGPGSGSNRVERGGGWYDGAGDCRVANRNGIGPGDSYSINGFRPVLPAGQ